MASPFAFADDLAARWRPLTEAETATAAALLDDASLRLRSEYPGIDDSITMGVLDAGIPKAVAVAMVKRVMLSGGSGVTQQSQGMGPFSQSQSYANPTGDLYITAAEDRFIRGYRPGGMSTTYNNDTVNVEGNAPGYIYGYGPW